MQMVSLDTTTWENWQLPYEHGMLNIWPPDSVREYINGFRTQHDPVSQRISEAHITLTQPFLRPPTQDMWKVISDIAAQHDAFELQYGPVRSFLPAPVIWLDVQPSASILSLRNALHNTGFFNLTLPHTENFTAHMTLTEGLSGSHVDGELLNKLSAEVSSGRFNCSEISYVRPSTEFQFSVHKVCRLRPI
jgi:2'-5' RNA ligase